MLHTLWRYQAAILILLGPALLGHVQCAFAQYTHLSDTRNSTNVPTLNNAPLAQSPIKVDGRLEPLLDDYLIGRLEGVELRLHQPTEREVVITHDLPWEGNTSGYHTVFHDGEKFRMYYRGMHWDENSRSEPHKEVTCYAESSDGITWRKPKLGLVEFQGSKANNIVWDGVGAHCFAPFLDKNPSCDSAEKYKAVAAGPGGLYTFKSPDGLRWSLRADKPVITEGAFDSQNLAFWDSARGQYLEFHRGFRDKVRDIMTGSSQDFQNWSKPEWLEYLGAPTEHLYTNQITPYPRAPHILVGFPMRFVEQRRTPHDKHHGGVSDGILMTSRDGRTFRRWTEAIIRPGLQTDRWVNRNNMTAWGILETNSTEANRPNELSIYSTEGYYRGPATRLRRFAWRLDGIVSANASMRGGQLITRPLTLARPQQKTVELLLNVSTSAAGSVRCEITNVENVPLAGFSLSDCDELFGDEIGCKVTWKGKSDLTALIGQPLRLRFELHDADLYALRFSGLSNK